jgi:hypothetical protein
LKKDTARQRPQHEKLAQNIYLETLLAWRKDSSEQFDSNTGV